MKIMERNLIWNRFLPASVDVLSLCYNFKISCCNFEFSVGVALLVVKTKNLGPVSLSDKTSYYKISQSLNAMRSVLSDHSEIWQTHQQHCCRCACQISKHCNNLNYQSCFQTSWDLMPRCLIRHWNWALLSSLMTNLIQQTCTWF